MFPILEILPIIIINLISLIIHPIFWLVVILVAMQYRRMSQIRQQFFGVKDGRWWPETLQATGYGFVGGLIGSVIIVVIGLTLSGIGLIYIWPLAIALMFINPRFLCFAYAGGILALFSLLFGWPPLNVAQILALVAILHLVESVLIYYSGHLGAVPAYIKVKSGKIVGGFILQRFWPIPLAILVVMPPEEVPAPQVMSMPDWWPLLPPALDIPPELLVFALIPIVAGLGYGDMVLTREPQQKASLSATYLAMYSIILLVLALLAEYSFLIALLAALFSFLGHEAIIYIARQTEFAARPVYIPPAQGMKVLDVLPNTPAWKIGIRSGDIILAIDDLALDNKVAFKQILSYPATVEILFTSGVAQKQKRERVEVNPKEPFGVLPVPEGNEETYVEISTSGFMKRQLEKFLK
ncbi:MAG: PDZ domain-containing protein [Desulfotomaculum sp.]|nr:PDZ domain-containing protein [Desulfotomaculum sp.]